MGNESNEVICCEALHAVPLPLRWSESEGVPEALVAAGIVKLSGITFQTGHVKALHAELTPIARDMYIRSRLDIHNRDIVVRAIDELLEKQKLTESQADALRVGLPGRVCTKLLREGLSVEKIILSHLESVS